MRTRALTRIRNRGGNDPRYTQERLQTRTQTVPEPNEENLLEVCKTLKEAVETLSGERGDIHNNGVSFADLEELGLVTIKEPNNDLQSNFVVTPEDWHEIGATGEPAFENSWVNQGAGAPVAAFYKDPWNNVHIQGHVNTGATGTDAFTLPVGYRPDSEFWFVLGSDIAVVDTDGTVNLTKTATNVLLGRIIFRVS